MAFFISGIQQVGIGIPNVKEAFKWYRTHFGMDIPIFEEAAEANLMLPYTGGKPHKRHAILALNENGGGGMEIWQYTSRTPEAPKFIPTIGDLGFFACKIKSFDVNNSYDYIKSKNAKLRTGLNSDPKNEATFFVNDPYGNPFQIVKSANFFAKKRKSTGGPFGVIVGVSNIEKSKKFYKEILGYDEIIYEKEGKFEDFSSLENGNENFKRVLLTHSENRKGPFAKMLGKTEIELVQALDRKPKKIFENRYWGDLGFIHLCFDIKGMDSLRKICAEKGHPFTVDSAASENFKETFDMGEAAGHFSYIEDPDGALIEFVETHKIPIFKKLNWYLDLRKRNEEKHLPKWMLKALTLNRVKD